VYKTLSASALNAPASVLGVPPNGLGHKFLINCQSKWFGQSQRREKNGVQFLCL
jgi:hypothetical protein